METFTLKDVQMGIAPAPHKGTIDHIALATILCAVYVSYSSYVVQKASPKASLSLFYLILRWIFKRWTNDASDDIGRKLVKIPK